MKGIETSEYETLFGEVKNRILKGQYEALKAVNRELISVYWDIGKLIVERQKNETWGKSVVDQLSRDLQKEFPGVRGFSASNIWRMRMFYLTYTDNQKLAPLVREIGWTHNIAIMEKCKDDLEREFYLRTTRKFGGTKNVLIVQIENDTYKKTLLNQTNFETTLPAEIQSKAKLAIKDEYTFDFLELGDLHSEKELEKEILLKLEAFLREMGGMFTFIGSQYRIQVEDEEYFIDLLLFHRAINCLIAVELKIGKFLPEYIGKMQFYLALLDDFVKQPHENPSIGIILCKSRNKTIVEYALRESSKPIGVAEYKIVSTLPEKFKGKLPSPEEIAKLLEEIE
jgi:predicted nuclease of restriction endonuclease-like (RecB) superfamily